MDRLHNWLRDHLNQSKTLHVRFSQLSAVWPNIGIPPPAICPQQCKLSDPGNKVKFKERTSSACLSPVIPVDHWYPTDPPKTASIQGAGGVDEKSAYISIQYNLFPTILITIKNIDVQHLRKHLCRLLDNLTKVRVMTKKPAKIEKPKEKEKGPPAYTVDDAMNKGRQLPQMLDFHKDRFRPVDHLCTSANSIWFSQKQGGWGT